MADLNLDADLLCTDCGSSLKLASRHGDGWRCLTCGAETAGTYGSEAGPVIVRTYRAKSQADAAAYMEADATALASDGYYPVSQSWAQGQWGCGAFLLALILCILLIGILVFIYLLIVKPDGTLTVTYQLREEVPAATVDTGETKVCPECAETIQAAARICRYCRHEFAAAT